MSNFHNTYANKIQKHLLDELCIEKRVTLFDVVVSLF